MRSKQIKANGVVLNYVEQGEGSAVVMVHGSLSDFRSWKPQVEMFSRRYRAIAYSRRYHYPNDCRGDERDYTVDVHAEDLAALIEQLGLGAAHVVGSSYGACVALALALKYPASVRSLILGEPLITSLLTRGGGAGVRFGNALEHSSMAFRKGDQRQALRAFVDGINGVGVFDRLSPADKQTKMDNAPALKSQVLSPDDPRRLNCAEIKSIETPALLLTGEVSQVMFRSIVDELERCLLRSERMTIPGATHAMHRSNPRAYHEAALEFLSRQEIAWLPRA